MSLLFISSRVILLASGNSQKLACLYYLCIALSSSWKRNLCDSARTVEVLNEFNRRATHFCCLSSLVYNKRQLDYFRLPSSLSLNSKLPAHCLGILYKLLLKKNCNFCIHFFIITPMIKNFFIINHKNALRDWNVQNAMHDPKTLPQEKQSWEKWANTNYKSLEFHF